MNRFWQNIVTVATVAGSIAAVVALWPIIFPPKPPPPPPEKLEYIIVRRLPEAIALDKTDRAHNITATLFSLVFFNETKAGFALSMCGPISYGRSRGDNLLTFRSSEYPKGLEAIDIPEFSSIYMNISAVGQFSPEVHVKIKDLEIHKTSIVVFIRIIFENEVGNRVSRYYLYYPGTDFEPTGVIRPTTQKHFDESNDLHQKILGLVESNIIVQRYQCRTTEVDLP